jgi:hypothetical protein
MKRFYSTILLLFGLFSFVNAQIKSTGVVSLSSNPAMTVNIEMNQTNSIVTLTLTGPSDRWFAIGFNTTSMSNNVDYVVYTTAFLDANGSGQNPPNIDTVNNWTVTNNTINGSSRTIVATRPFTGDGTDYNFNYSTSSFNIIWAYSDGASVVLEEPHIFGSKTLNYTVVLGVDDFSPVLNQLVVYPNPAKGTININNEVHVQITKIRIFNVRAQLIKEIEIDTNNLIVPVDISNIPVGVYFMEISSDNDRTVKKIEIK